MRFDREEVAAILRKHITDTFGIPFEAEAPEVAFLGMRAGTGGDYVFTAADVTVPTENAVPTGMGPYRTAGR